MLCASGPSIIHSVQNDVHAQLSIRRLFDPANPLIVNNENGNQNSYLIIDPNYTFRLKGYGNATSVFFAGDFNDWGPQTLRMIKDGDDWIFSLHLFTGKHL